MTRGFGTHPPVHKPFGTDPSVYIFASVVSRGSGPGEGKTEVMRVRRGILFSIGECP